MRKVSFPNMGNYQIPFATFASLLGEVIIPPPITKRTLELGTRLSPDTVCVPFKFTLGTYVEALERGADTLIQAGGGCRMGYYADVQHKILRDAGYEFEFVKLNNDNYTLGVISDIKRVRPELSYWEIWKCFRTAMAQLHAIDEVERVIRKNAGFECFPGMLEQLHKAFLLGLKDAHTPKEAHNVKTSYLKLIEKTPVNRPDRPLRVGVLGELYVVMEPYSNFFIEKELGSRGVEVTRFVTASCIVDVTKADIRRLVKISNPYLKYDLGAHGTESVAMTLQLARRGYDGIIHVKPFGCMPEINAMPAMHHISRDTGIPVMYMSFDAQTSETGVKTRIEAFCDMISMRRQTCKGI